MKTLFAFLAIGSVLLLGVGPLSPVFSPYPSGPTPTGWWPINEGGAATTALDTSGNGHNGTWSGTQSGTGGTSYYVPGHVLSFAGAFNSSAGSPPEITVSGFTTVSSNAITVSAWVNPGVTTRGDLVTQWDGAAPNFYAHSQYDLLYGLSGAIPEFFVTEGTSAHGSGLGSTAMTTGTWNHVCGQYDGATISVYLNGTLESSASLSITMNTSSILPLIIGNNDAASSNPTTGDIEDVRVYNVAPSSLCPALNAAGPQS